MLRFTGRVSACRARQGAEIFRTVDRSPERISATPALAPGTDAEGTGSEKAEQCARRRLWNNRAAIVLVEIVDERARLVAEGRSEREVRPAVVILAGCLIQEPKADVILIAVEHERRGSRGFDGTGSSVVP